MKQSKDCNQQQILYSHQKKWWAYLDLNRGPRPYQGRALTN